MTTPAHLVHHHGYDRKYAAMLSPALREAEHDRLHADETAKHLDHEHTPVMRIQVYAWPDGTTLEDVGDRAVDVETGGPVVTVPEETGRRWLEAQQAWQAVEDEAVATAYPKNPEQQEEP